MLGILCEQCLQKWWHLRISKSWLSLRLLKVFLSEFSQIRFCLFRLFLYFSQTPTSTISISFAWFSSFSIEASPPPLPQGAQNHQQMSLFFSLIFLSLLFAHFHSNVREWAQPGFSSDERAHWSASRMYPPQWNPFFDFSKYHFRNAGMCICGKIAYKLLFIW